MAYDVKSKNTLEFAESVVNRALGNHDDQRVILGDPNRKFEYGILFSYREAQFSRKGNRTDVRPNAMSARFEVEDTGEPLELRVTPSFWLYFRHQYDHFPPDDVGDTWSPESIWQDWTIRPVPRGSPPSGEKLSEDSPRIFIRTRYTKTFTITLLPGQKSKTAELDLNEYKKSRGELGRAPEWTGAIHVATNKLDNDNLEIKITLENQYRKKLRESAWFDVRMKIDHNRELHDAYCPLLEVRVPAQTVNCVLANETEDAKTGEIILEQINLAVRHRQAMIASITFDDANWAEVAETIQEFAGDASDRHAEQLRKAVREISADATAMQAVDIVLETFRCAMRARVPDGSAKWYRHQLAILVLGILEYLTGQSALNPLVINVPTAGGKTEAFSALAFWAVAFEVLQPNPTWATAIIKYPTKLLSSDQAERLSHYVMHFDNIMVETLGRSEERRGLGLFFGSDREGLDRLEIIGKNCPECGTAWRIPKENDSPTTIQCENNHQVVIALKNEIFPRPPTLIVGTIDKFVSKSQRREMAAVLGGSQIYYCPVKKRYMGKDYCWGNKKREEHDHQLVTRKARLTVLILDEAHLLREEVGSLDSHFETFYLETARELSGRYPLAVISTATIAQAEEHCRQLGLGKPTLFPGRERENNPAYYETDYDRIQHIVLSYMPRGRSIAWALPHLAGHYLYIHDLHTLGKEDHIKHLRPVIIYCNSYMNRNLTRESIKRYIEPKMGEIAIGEFSRQRFNDVGMRHEVDYIEDKDVILSTNIASVGVDLGNLNAIMYFGFPYNINEFIQSMNRTGRRDPAIVAIVHNPYLERDAAFYAYLKMFLQYPEKLVEAVPLNRFARRAIEHTFSSIALGLLYHVWSDRIEGADLARARKYFLTNGFKEVYGKDLSAESVIGLLLHTFRADKDPSNAYPDEVKKRWNTMATNIMNYHPQNRKSEKYKFGDNWVRNAEGVSDPMYQLRIPSPQGDLVLSPRAEKLAKANIKAIYGNEKDAEDDIADEESGIQDGALTDDRPDEGDEE